MSGSERRNIGAADTGRLPGAVVDFLGFFLVVLIAVAAWMYADELAAWASANASTNEWSLIEAYRSLGNMLVSGPEWLLAQAEGANKKSPGGLLILFVCLLLMVGCAILGLVVMLIAGVVVFILSLIPNFIGPITSAGLVSGVTLVTIRAAAVGVGLRAGISLFSALRTTVGRAAGGPRGAISSPPLTVGGTSPRPMAGSSSGPRPAVAATAAPVSTDSIHSQSLDDRIDALDELGWAALGGSRSWTEVWDEIKSLGNAFKTVRYATAGDREAALQRFQRIVGDIKERQGNQRSIQRGVASTHRDRLIWHINNATVLGFEGVLGEPSRDELMYMSEEIREAWRYFEAHKAEFGGEEKGELYGRLRETQDGLDRAWVRFKQQNVTLREQQREEQARSQEEWCAKVRARIQQHEEKLAKLGSALRDARGHLNTLEDRVGQARSESRREKIEERMEETIKRIERIETEIKDREEWLERDLEKVQRC